MYKVVVGSVFSLLTIVTFAGTDHTHWVPSNSSAKFKSMSSDANDYNSNVLKSGTDVVESKSIVDCGSATVVKKDVNDPRPYFGIIAGAGIAKIGKQQMNTTSGGVDTGYDQYLPSNRYYAAVLAGINAGYEFRGGVNGALSLGLGIYQTSDYLSKGQVRYVYEPRAINHHQLDYEYKLHSTRLMVETEIAWRFDLNEKKIIPFVSFGIGPSVNFANDYRETLADPSASTKPTFKSKMNINLAYQVGAGIAAPFNSDRDRLFVAYRYVDLGEVRFDSDCEGYSPYQLDVERVRSNEVYIGYTHFFDF